MTLWCLTFINHILYVQSTSSVACRIHCLLFGFCEECGVERRGMNACGVILNLFNSIFSKCVLTQVRCKSGFCFFSLEKYIFYAEITIISTYTRSDAVQKFTKICSPIRQPADFTGSRKTRRVKTHMINICSIEMCRFQTKFNKYISSWSACIENNESVINNFDEAIFYHFIHIVSTSSNTVNCVKLRREKKINKIKLMFSRLIA